MPDRPDDDDPLLRPPAAPPPQLGTPPGPELMPPGNPKGSLYAERSRRRAPRDWTVLALYVVLAALIGAGVWLALR